MCQAIPEFLFLYSFNLLYRVWYRLSSLDIFFILVDRGLDGMTFIVRCRYFGRTLSGNFLGVGLRPFLRTARMLRSVRYSWALSAIVVNFVKG